MHSTLTSIDIGNLYQAHHGWLQGWLRKKLGCREQAADLAHDTFTRLLNKPGNIPKPDQPRAFLTVIARRLLIDHARRTALEHAYQADLIAGGGESVAPSPEHLLLITEALSEVASALQQVGTRAREAFLLHYLDGIGQNEVAARLGVSPRMVRKYLVQCLLACEQAGLDAR